MQNSRHTYSVPVCCTLSTDHFSKKNRKRTTGTIPSSSINLLKRRQVKRFDLNGPWRHVVLMRAGCGLSCRCCYITCVWNWISKSQSIKDTRKRERECWCEAEACVAGSSDHHGKRMGTWRRWCLGRLGLNKHSWDGSLRRCSASVTPLLTSDAASNRWSAVNSTSNPASPTPPPLLPLPQHHNNNHIMSCHVIIILFGSSQPPSINE